MDTPKIAQKAPFPVEVEAGRSYMWCACGLSGNQPFCDGSHKGTGIAPVRYKPDEGGEAYLCGCKQTGDAPLCDGTHSKL